MTKDAYISRLRKARQAAQEQLTAGLSGAKLLLKETGAITQLLLLARVLLALSKKLSSP